MQYAYFVMSDLFCDNDFYEVLQGEQKFIRIRFKLEIFKVLSKKKLKVN